jgi:hypothetical protein
MLFGRPFIIATICFLLAYLFVIRRWVIPLCFIILFSVLLSHLFVFTLLLCVVGTLWYVLIGSRRDALLTMGSAVVGCTVGLLLHPHTIEYLRYIATVFLRIPFSKYLGVGAELMSVVNGTDFGYLLIFSMVFSFVAFLPHTQKRSLSDIVREQPHIGFTVMLLLIFLFLYCLWIRAIDYLWPLTMLLCVQLLSVRGVEEWVRGGMTRPLFQKPGYPRVRGVHLLACLLIFHFFMLANRLHEIDDRNPQAFAAVQELPAGSRVLNVNWGIFPPLMYHNPHVLYARGMDPTFDYIADPEGFALMDRINDRLEKELHESGWNPIQWVRSLWSRRMEGSLAFRTNREPENLDAAAWLTDIRAYFDPDYLVFVRGNYEKLMEQFEDLEGKRVRRLPGEEGVLTVFEVL